MAELVLKLVHDLVQLGAAFFVGLTVLSDGREPQLVRRAVETGDAYTDEPDFLLKTHVIEQITRCFINGFRSAGRGIKRDPAGHDPKICILDFERDHAALKPLFP